LGKWYDKLVRFLRAEDGPTSVEYAIVLALILMVCVASISNLSASPNTTFTTVGSTLGSTGS
jgi:pilus assembly protein Flp/PilA